MRRTEQAREPHPVPPADGELRQREGAVGDGTEVFQRHVHAAVGVPRVEGLGLAQGRFVAFHRRGIAVGQPLRGGVELGQGSAGVGELDVDEVADGAALDHVDLLLGNAQGPDAPDGPGVGLEHPGEDVQERGLAASVLAHDPPTGVRGDGEVRAGQHGASAAVDTDALRGELGAFARGHGC